jgi:hypothetical protein
MPDRAARPEAPATEIEVTPEMIDAGVETLWASGAVGHPLQADRLVVQAVFESMLLRRSTSALVAATTSTVN